MMMKTNVCIILWANYILILLDFVYAHLSSISFVLNRNFLLRDYNINNDYSQSLTFYHKFFPMQMWFGVGISKMLGKWPATLYQVNLLIINYSNKYSLTYKMSTEYTTLRPVTLLFYHIKWWQAMLCCNSVIAKSK